MNIVKHMSNKIFTYIFNFIYI